MTDKMQKIFDELLAEALTDKNRKLISDYEAATALSHLFVCYDCPFHDKCPEAGHSLNCQKQFTQKILPY